MKEIEIGEKWRGKIIKDKIVLSNGWILIKTENSKSENDFKVKVIFSRKPLRSMTPKHAHFLIDFYGKLCYDRQKTRKLFDAIVEVWKSEDVAYVLDKYGKSFEELPGYPAEYILYALRWILLQEDINFRGRPPKRQMEINEIFKRLGIALPGNREGSQLAIAMFGDVLLGTHPVEALIKVGLDIRPTK